MQLYSTSCVYDNTTVAGSLDSYPVVASSTCVISTIDPVANPVSYYDFVFFATVALFLLSFVPMGLIWSILKKR